MSSFLGCAKAVLVCVSFFVSFQSLFVAVPLGIVTLRLCRGLACAPASRLSFMKAVGDLDTRRRPVVSHCPRPTLWRFAVLRFRVCRCPMAMSPSSLHEVLRIPLDCKVPAQFMGDSHWQTLRKFDGILGRVYLITRCMRMGLSVDIR